MTVFAKPVQRKVSGEAPPIITDGLVGYWPFDEGSGTTATDNSPSGNNGILLNMDASNWEAGSGVGGYELRFNGTNESVDLGDTTPEITFEWNEPFSYVAWVNLDSGGTGLGQFIIGKMADSGTERGIDFFFRNGSTGFQLIIRLRNDTAGARHIEVESQNADLVLPNTRTNVIATYDGSGQGSGVVFYSAGAAVPVSITRNNLGDRTIVTGQNFTIGARNNVRNWFKGKIDAPRVYNRVLTAQEAADIAAGTG